MFRLGSVICRSGENILGTIDGLMKNDPNMDLVWEIKDLCISHRARGLSTI